MKGVCGMCGKPGVVHRYRWQSGKPTCPTCYRQCDIGRCAECGKMKIILALDRCRTCYRNSKVGECVECGEMKVIHALDRCYCCYQRRRRAHMTASPA